MFLGNNCKPIPSSRPLFVRFSHHLELYRFLDKTKNNWEDREKFEKVPGKYDMLQMDYTTNTQVNSDYTFREELFPLNQGEV